MYPIEKNLVLMYERFNKSGSQAVNFDEFKTAITPFLQGVGQKSWELCYFE